MLIIEGITSTSVCC